MSQNFSPNIVAELLDRAAVREELSYLQAAETSLAPERMSELQTTAPIVLGQAALNLCERMCFLQRNSHLPARLGGSVCKMSLIKRYPDIISTPLLITHEPERVGNRLLTSGYTFSTRAYPNPNEPRSLTANRYIIDKDTGEEASVGGYGITMYMANESQINGVYIMGSEFTEYHHAAVHASDTGVQAFLDAHPEFDPEDPFMDRDLGNQYAQLMTAFNRLVKTPPIIDFPDAMYIGPTGLLMQARKELARTKWFGRW